GVGYKVGVVNEADGTISTLMQDRNIGDRFWPHLSTTPDLQRFVFTSSDKHPPDVWLGEITHEGDMLTSSNRKCLTELNPILKDTLELAHTERIGYESANGWQIDALLMLPLKHKCYTLSPLIVNVHGRPSIACSDAW